MLAILLRKFLQQTCGLVKYVETHLVWPTTHAVEDYDSFHMEERQKQSSLLVFGDFPSNNIQNSFHFSNNLLQILQMEWLELLCYIQEYLIVAVQSAP